MYDKYYIYAIITSLLLFIIIHKISKNKKPILRGLLSVSIGLISLIVVNIAGVYTGVTLPYSMLSVTISAIGGIPGVTAMLGLNLFF